MRLVGEPVRHQPNPPGAAALELAGHLLHHVEPERRLTESAEDDFGEARRVAGGGEHLRRVGFLREFQIVALVDAIAQEPAEKTRILAIVRDVEIERLADRVGDASPIRLRPYPEQAAHVLRSEARHLLRRHPVEFGQGLRNASDVGRFVSLAPVRRGSEIGAVRLKQNALYGNPLENFPQLFRARERDGPARAQVKIDVQEFSGLLVIAREAVDDAARAPRSFFL